MVLKGSNKKLLLLLIIATISSYNANASDILCANITTSGIYTLNQSIIDYDAAANGVCMNISVSNVVLDCQGNTIDYAKQVGSNIGVLTENTDNITITNCKVTNFGLGFSTQNATNIILTNDNFSKINTGIFINKVNGLIINNVNVTNNSLIIGDSSDTIDDAVISNATINCLGDTDDGFNIVPSAGTNITVKNVNVTGCPTNVILFYNVNGLIMDEMTISANDGSYPFWIQGCSNSLSRNITVKDCGLTDPFAADEYAFYLSGNTNLTITNSSVKNCNFSFDMQDSTSINIFNNFFNTTWYPSFTANNLNVWNTTLTAGSRIFGPGVNIGGNFWALTNGTGYSQTCTDANTDGFCDNPFDLYAQATCTQDLDCGNNTDYRALSDDYVGSSVVDSIVIVINSSVNGSHSTIPSFNVTVTDNSSTLCNCTLYIDNNPYNTTNNIANNTVITMTSNTSGLDGNYSVYVNCTGNNNTAGSSTTTQGGIIIIVDNTPPAAGIFNFTVGSNTTDSTPSFNFTYNDTWSSNATAVIIIDGVNNGFNNSVYNNTNSSITANTTLLDGNHTVYINITDLAGNSVVTQEINITVDANGPTINILRPRIHNWTNNNTPLVMFNISDTISPPGNCTLSVNGTMYGTNDTVWNWTNTNITINATLLDAANYSLTVNCTDGYGNKGTSTRQFHIDTQPPIINVTELYLTSLIPTFKVNFSDTLSPEAMCIVTSGFRGVKDPVYNNTITIIVADNQRYEGNVTCIDRAGNKASNEIVLNIDDSPPVVTINNPSSDNWTNDNTTDITFTVTDGTSRNTSCIVSINGTSYGTNSTVRNDSSTTITTSEITNGVNLSLRVNCTDEGGNTGTSQSQRISIDSTIPRVVKVATFNLTTAYANSSLSCNFSFADTLSDTETLNISWFVNNTLLNNSFGTIVNNNTESETGSFSGYFRRDHNVSCNITGTDRSGNSVTTENQITITNSPPRADNVTITPTPATTTDDLICDYDYVDNDQDTEATVYYEWTVNGIINSANGSVLGRGNFTIDSLILCKVIVYDGTINSSTVESPTINLSDVIAPNITNITMPSTTGYNSEVYDIYATCADTSSDLMNNYPKISFKDPNGVTQGNFTMTQVYGYQYKYSYAFTTPGLYQDFYVYCRDAQDNLAITGGNMTFLSINGSAQIITITGGGTKEVTTVSIQNISLASFCGDGVCDKDESPLRCSQDCKVNLETALTCLWKNPKSCLYTKTWFATLLLLFVIMSALYFTYRIETNKEPEWVKKWF